MPGILAVHDTTSGATLWQRELSRDVPFQEGAQTLFITDRVTGFVRWLERRCFVEMYDVRTGNFIGSQERDARGWSRAVTAKGTHICYDEENGLDIHVVKIVDNEIKKYVFPFPTDIMGQSNNLAKEIQGSTIRLIGFVKKSQLLIGQLILPQHLLLFGLDLDAAISADNEDKT